MERIVDFTECGQKILKALKKYKPKIIEEPSSDCPVFTIVFEKRGLRRWKMGIWATGKWSDFYDVDSDTEDCVCVFLKHRWNIDKFRPSWASENYRLDIPFHDFVDFTEYHLREIKNLLSFIKNNQAYAYFLDCSSLPKGNCSIAYLKDWWINAGVIPFYDKWWKRKASTKLLFGFLKFISWFDPRIDCSKTRLFDEGSMWPRYTSGFCATIKTSQDNDRLYRAWRLYSVFPRWLQRHTGHTFDGSWNLSDQTGEESEKELRTKIWKGIYFSEVEEDEQPETTESNEPRDTTKDRSIEPETEGNI